MSENDNKNIEKLDDNLDLTTENEEDNSENNPDIDPELTKIDQSLLDENGDYDKIQPINLSNEMQNSFLSYAMSVIVSRALPDVRDGLKPVHRRILYAMNELGVYSDRPHKKSARIVGDVIGKYHPHGDTAVYEAMVRMAQDFSYRYPLVDGHGNFGSIDGDGAAAMRYTEARMSKLAGEMLRDLNKNTVDFGDNYDGSEREPLILPARFPSLLVNGASGIAVGMATSIPTHNLTEVINGTLALIENPDITIEQLMEYILAPDFPTGATIMGLSSVKKAYQTGMGTVTVRAKVATTTMQNGKKELIITEIPYQVNKTRLIERIAELAKDKIIDGITDLRDESNRKGMRIVIELRRDANVNVILNNLYKHTQMQTTYSVNMIALDHGQPKVLNLKQILECYVKHQIEVVTRRTKYDLDKAKSRCHIVEGLLIALANIDEVVATIKASKNTDEAIKQLIEKFLLTEIQAKAILDMKLQRLTGLEIEKLEQEQKELKQLLHDYRPYFKKYNTEVAEQNIEATQQIVKTQSQLLELIHDKSQYRIDMNYYINGQRFLLQMRIKPYTDKQYLEGMGTQMGLFRDLNRDEKKLIAKAETKQPMSPEEHKMYQALSDKIMEKAYDLDNNLKIINEFLADRMEFVDDPEKTFEENLQFWEQIDLDTKTSLFHEVRGRLKLNDTFTEELFPPVR